MGRRSFRDGRLNGRRASQVFRNESPRLCVYRLVADQIGRRLPVGAEVVSSGGVHFRVWAPERKTVEVVLAGDPPQSEGTRYFELQREEGGYFSGLLHAAITGSRYKYRLDGSDSDPDPASRFQPKGPHELSH